MKKISSPFLSKDPMRGRRSSSRPTTPARSNGVVQTDASAVSTKSSASSSQVPVKVGANSLANKAPINEHDRTSTFWPSSSLSSPFYPIPPNYYYYPNMALTPASNICYYVPTLPQISYPFAASPFSYNIVTPSIYTQTLDFPSISLPIPYVTLLRLNITSQIEHYFGDDNLAKDPYLRLNMDSEGWVPITLIARFRKVSELSKDAQFVRDSLIYATKVEVQGDKVRRRDNWEKWLLKIKQRKEVYFVLD